MGKYSWLCKLQHPFITQTKKYKTEQCRLNLLDFFSNKRHSYLKIYLNRSIKFLVSIFRYSDFLCIDLYEFHFYCLRQLYNRSYLELLKFVSCMYQKKNFYRIILYITWQCVVLHDQPDKFWIEFSTIYGNSIVGSKTNHILLNMIPLKLAEKYFSILDRYTISQPELLKAIFEIATRKNLVCNLIKYSWLCKLQHLFITQIKKYKMEQCRLNLLDFFSNKRYSYLKIYLNRSIKFLVSIFRYSDSLCIDLYEFHSYCLRQLYNRSYLELLKFVSCMHQKKNFY